VRRGMVCSCIAGGEVELAVGVAQGEDVVRLCEKTVNIHAFKGTVRRDVTAVKKKG
jgi:hypothetical protein